MESIAKKIKECNRCSLCKNITNKVIGKGVITPKIIFVGEAPGEDENSQGIPFVGKSGKWLDKLIADAGIKEYAVINAIKCRPPADREPQQEELDMCKPFFDEQIDLLKCNRIVALGKVALKQLELDGETIVARVGTVEQSKYGDVFILPNHAHILKNPDFKIPIDKLKEFYVGKKENMVLLDNYVMNFQEAENAGKFEMIGAELASIHNYCKKAGSTFVDHNQKDLCMINNKLTYIKKFSQTNEIDLFEEELVSGRLKDVKLFVFYAIEKGCIHWIGWTSREEVDNSEMGYHFQAEKNCKKIMYDTLKQMNTLLPVFVEKKDEEEAIYEQPFVHLHTHSEYSIGDGFGSMKQIAEALKKKGFKACALTDHGTMSGAIYWQKNLLEKGVKPIFGCEVYLILDDKKDAPYFHLTILAKDITGWKNLIKIQERAVRTNFYYRPRTFIGDLLRLKEGLIVCSGCCSGVVAKQFLEDKPDEAEKILIQLKEEFGEDFYAELMPNRLDIQIKYNAWLVDMINKYNLKYVITSDSHYPNADQEKFHKAIKAVALRKKYDESGFGDNTFYLLQEPEIRQLIIDHHPSINQDMVSKAFAYSLEVSDKCNMKIPSTTEDTLPKLYENPEETLRTLTYEGLKKFTKYSAEEVSERLELELGRFIKKEYANYFLVVHDYVKWCKENGIMVGPGRGSCGGSLVAYALNITETDPLKFDLLFDRFISEIRKDAPDIDLDFEDTKRDRLFKYFKDKYGEEHFAKIMTFSTWHAKGALRDVGRIFNIPNTEINKICNLVVVRSGGDARASFCLLDTFTEFEQAKKFYADHRFACDIAVGLESHIRHRGVHAAGITLTEKPITDFVPIEKVNGEIVTAWEKREIETVGLVKFDVLGLKTLSVISDAIESIKKRHGVEVKLPQDFEDPKVYNTVFKEGLTLGIFQFETTGLSKLSKQLAINDFKLLYDTTTLYRPGPLHSGETSDYVLRHNKEKKWTYDHPLLEPITKDSYGLILYQEQVMKVMFDLGKFSWATAESARKIMTKSAGKDAFNKMRKEFCENALREHNIPVVESEKIFDVVSTFGSYGFNKSHAVEYSIISYWCAWLKTYYPAEFFTTMMSREGDENRIADYIRDAKRFGLKVKTPDVSISKIGFSFTEDMIIAGLDNIKGIAGKTAEKVICKQPFETMEDFLKKVKPSCSMIKAFACSGALDSLFNSRKFLFDNAEKISKSKVLQTVLDGNLDDWTEEEKIKKMSEYVELPSDKPLIDFYENPFESKVQITKIGELEFKEYINELWIKGIVNFINFKQEGLEGQWTMFDNVLERRYAHLNLTDGTGNILVHLSPEQYTYYKRFLEKGTGFPVLIRGHSIPNFNKIYCDAMIVLTEIDWSNPIIKYINKETDMIIKINKEKSPQFLVGMVESVSYKVSKNKKPYARLKLSSEEKPLMCFKLDSNIFITGEVIVYAKQDPFLSIIKRIKGDTNGNTKM